MREWGAGASVPATEKAGRHGTWRDTDRARCSHESRSSRSAAAERVTPLSASDRAGLCRAPRRTTWAGNAHHHAAERYIACHERRMPPNAASPTSIPGTSTAPPADAAGARSDSRANGACGPWRAIVWSFVVVTPGRRRRRPERP